MRQRIAKFFFQKALDMYNLAEYFNETPGDITILERIVHFGDKLSDSNQPTENT